LQGVGIRECRFSGGGGNESTIDRRYSFTAGLPAAGALRPLRDPDVRELDGDEEGQE
jgi:hypothetical protein